MATLDASLTVFAEAYRFSDKSCLSLKSSFTTKLHASTTLFRLPHNHNLHLVLSSKASLSRKPCFELYSALQEVATEAEAESEQTPSTNVKKKLFVFNLPLSLSVSDIKSLFGQCGTPTDVEIIRNKDGRSRGFAFITMASGEEALAAIDKFDSHEVSGRIIRVEFAKRFKRPPPPGSPTGVSETRHVIYASNLAWKARSTHLRQFFTENFKPPVSARVVFETPSGRSAGYGFVSYVTKEEAETAISALDGKELMGRPLRLKFSQKKVEEDGREKDEDQVYDAQLEIDPSNSPGRKP